MALIGPDQIRPNPCESQVPADHEQQPVNCIERLFLIEKSIDTKSKN